MADKLVNLIASTLDAWKRCQTDGNREWEDRHAETLRELVAEMPSGSGFDSGTKLDVEASSADRLVFETSFHHMNDVGMHDGWTEHTVIVKPSFIGGMSISVTGRNRNDIKEFIVEAFQTALSAPFVPAASAERAS